MSPPVSPCLQRWLEEPVTQHRNTTVRLKHWKRVWDISIRKSRYAKVRTETHTGVSSNVWNLWRNLESRGCRCPSVPPCPMFTCCSPLADRATDSAAPTYQHTTPRANKKSRWGGSVRMPVSVGVHGCMCAWVRACEWVAAWPSMWVLGVLLWMPGCVRAWVRARACACSSVSVGACWCAFVCAGL
jgi:hypothetical protein